MFKYLQLGYIWGLYRGMKADTRSLDYSSMGILEARLSILNEAYIGSMLAWVRLKNLAHKSFIR